MATESRLLYPLITDIVRPIDHVRFGPKQKLVRHAVDWLGLRSNRAQFPG
jgi:hypothetical protein